MGCLNDPVKIERIAAFSDGEVGGSPAGVAILDTLPDVVTMQRTAAAIGYSETAFAAPHEADWRVRYFAPEMEVPFCGHATIALGAALAMRQGNGVFPLALNDARITVEGYRTGSIIGAALRSPPTRSAPADPGLVANALALFGYPADALDARLPPAIIEAGARHLFLALDRRATLAAMKYDQAAGAELMRRAGVVTITLAFAETAQRFHVRNPFAAGGVYEDPATGAAAAALGGYLRDLGWPHGGAVEIIQGEDMGMRSRLLVEITATPNDGVRVSGTARVMTEREADRSDATPG